MNNEDLIDLSTLNSAKLVRGLGLTLFSLDLPYFIDDTKIYYFARNLLTDRLEEHLEDGKISIRLYYVFSILGVDLTHRLL